MAGPDRSLAAGRLIPARGWPILGAVKPEATAMTAESELIALSAERDAVLIGNDADAVAGYMADEWVYVGPTGPVPKTDIIGWIATGRLQHHKMQMASKPRVVVHGDTAIVTARMASSGSWDGEPYAADEWISDVYVRRDGHWLSVFSQKCAAE
jgi:ketosteroid isomerase-like protein